MALPKQRQAAASELNLEGSSECPPPFARVRSDTNRALQYRTQATEENPARSQRSHIRSSAQEEISHFQAHSCRESLGKWCRPEYAARAVVPLPAPCHAVNAPGRYVRGIATSGRD